MLYHVQMQIQILYDVCDNYMYLKFTIENCQRNKKELVKQKQIFKLNCEINITIIFLIKEQAFTFTLKDPFCMLKLDAVWRNP